MGYIEKVMGDNERLIYRTHQHLLLFLRDTILEILAFLLFLALGVAFFIGVDSGAGLVIWVIALCSLIVPIFLAVRSWMRGYRGRDLLKAIWIPVLVAITILTLALLRFLPDPESVGWVAIGFCLIPFAVFVYEFLDWLNRRYIITNRRVVKVHGIIQKHVYDYALEKVNDLKLDQSFWGRLVRWGEMEILTAADLDYLEQQYADDPDGFQAAYSDRYIWAISNPVRFKRELLNAKEQLHAAVPSLARQEGVLGASAPSAPEEAKDQTVTAQQASIPDLIEELDELRKKGLLTDREFRAKKKDLLDRM